jgi:hypothetical protein
VKSEILAAVIENTVFWDAMPYNLIKLLPVLEKKSTLKMEATNSSKMFVMMYLTTLVSHPRKE